MMSKYTIIDLFSGAGGLSYGFEMAGCEVKLAIEKDAWAVETYKANHKNQNVFELDITTLPDDYADRERRKRAHQDPFNIDAELIIDLYNRVCRHLNAIWWKPKDAVENGKIINRPT